MPRPQKSPLRSLTSRERAALEQIARAGREGADRVLRAIVLLAVADGARFTTAARLVGRRSGDAVARLVARWNDEGLAALEPLYVRAAPATIAVAAGIAEEATPRVARSRRRSAPQPAAAPAANPNPTDPEPGISLAQNGVPRAADIDRVMDRPWSSTVRSASPWSISPAT